ncbi:MAG: O-antigen ligase family protein, partial [bacterium]|nr:O-antigen ligase family protein [bacterium]
FFNNPSYLAVFMLFSIGMAGILWASIKKEHQKWANFVIGGLILFFLATFVFTQTRGAYLGLAVGFLLFTLLLLACLRREKKKLTLGAIGVSTLILISIGSIFVFKGSGFITGNQILNRIAVVSDLTNLGAARERYLGWIIAFESFKDRPLFGWGPENYDIAFNEHYNYLAAKDEPWFDSSHNQLMDVLAEGGIVGLSLYLFWIGTIFYTVRKLLKRGTKDKLIGAIIAGTYLGFLIQGWFLFDTFPMYLGLFPLLGFAYFRYEDTGSDVEEEAVANRRSLRGPWFYILAVLLLILIPFLIFKNVWQPFQANHLIINFNQSLYAGSYKGAANYLETASGINSPYTNFDVGNQTGWIFLYFLDNQIPAKNKEIVRGIWQQVVAREEKSLGIRPLDPQAYYVLGRLYRRGYDRFNDPDSLARAEAVLKEGRELSYDRVEYVYELVDVLLAEGKIDEADRVIEEYASRIPSPYSHVIKARFYFLEKKYDLAAKSYKQAEAAGYPFWSEDNDYAYFMAAAENLKDYQTVLRVSREYISRRGPTAVAYFNQAAASYYLGEKGEARKAYLKAVNLDRSYEQYASFFTSQ